MLKAILINLFDVRNDKHIDIPYFNDLLKDLQKNGIKYSILSYLTPLPEHFSTAAEQLNVLPNACLVIGDTYASIASAATSGMTCIGYSNPNLAKQDLSKAVMLVEGFEEIDYNFLKQVYQTSNPEPITIFTTEHFIIKELSVEDIDELYRICQTPSIKKYVHEFDDNLSVEKEKHQAYIKNIYRFYGFGLWGVYFKENNQLIGRCGIEYRHLNGEDIYELGYLLDQQHQGFGYAKEFVMETLNYCFLELNIHRIVAVIEQSNTRSIHLAEQVGMIKSGCCIQNQRECHTYEITYHS